MEINKLRCFFAVPISSECKIQILRIISDLKLTHNAGIRWVKSDNLHLTLKFLGEFISTDIPVIENILKPIFTRIIPFHIIFQDLGVFPNAANPKVIWIGIHYPEFLTRVYKEIESAAFALGYPKESRPFSPHLTIGRVKNETSDSKKISLLIKKYYSSEICTSLVGRVVFFQSNLTPSGPVYSELFHLTLKP